MRFSNIALSLLTLVVVTGNVLAQDEVIARAYRTVNVRSGPGTQYDIIGQLNSGNDVPVTGRSDDENNWLRIDFAGGEGWVAFFTVTVLGELDQVPIVAQPNDQPGTLPRLVLTPTPMYASSDVYVTAYRRVNVRSGPGSNYVSVGNLEPGSSADVTGKSEDNEWLRIDYQGTPGWVAFFVVSLTGSLDGIDLAQADADAKTEEPQNTLEVVTRYNVNLHEKPMPDSSIIETIVFNTLLQADARSDDAATWLRVTSNGQTGWLIRTLVNITGEPGDLPIETEP